MSLGFFFFFFFLPAYSLTHIHTHIYRVPCSCNGHLGVKHPVLSHDISACVWEEARGEFWKAVDRNVGCFWTSLCSLNIYCSGCVQIKICWHWPLLEMLGLEEQEYEYVHTVSDLSSVRPGMEQDHTYVGAGFSCGKRQHLSYSASILIAAEAVHVSTQKINMTL